MGKNVIMNVCAFNMVKLKILIRKLVFPQVYSTILYFLPVLEALKWLEVQDLSLRAFIQLQEPFKLTFLFTSPPLFLLPSWELPPTTEECKDCFLLSQYCSKRCFIARSRLEFLILFSSNFSSRP